MDLKLSGHNVLITGGTKGIGRAIAETLATEGCNIGLCARNEDDVTSAVAALSEKGVKVTGRALDVADGEAFAAWIQDAGEELGGVDAFVSNVSGGNAPGDEGWISQFNYNILSAVHGVEACKPFFEKSDNPSVVMISTTAALEHFMNAGPYNAMKAGLLNYSGALSQELGAKGVRVNAISPGPIFIEGGSWDKIKQGMAPFYESTLATIPLGRMGSAEEVAAQAALLISPLGGFTTGTNVVIDGGMTKRIQY
ncbi:MAG: SDR family oxidoreductase [Pseudomonadales bacterium]|jgi:3-oxoacyl-[acyl-carrier protein] reductase|nr:SDR family oxidoreductase [Pseudomonadales bacterium]MDA0762037.1 SDR family oxidoreductase [Pseudomonadota bacterium]MDA0958032.1 SDR family oxidoreductase [Pseudomonadota bacterium]